MTDAKQIRVLANERSRALLLAFAPEPRSVSSLAAALDEPVAKVFYHVRNFVGLGLLKETHQERRPGKPIRYYTTVARTFFLPAEAVERQFTAGMAEELRAALEGNFNASDIDGILISAGDDGSVDMQLQRDPRRRRSASAAEFWQVLRLDDTTAKSLAGELRELFERYEALSGKGPEFLVHAALAKRRK